MAIIHPKRKDDFIGKDTKDDTGTKGNESRFKRCQHCGAINDTELRTKGDGWGNNINHINSGAVVTTLKYPAVGGTGCWSCGSSEGW